MLPPPQVQVAAYSERIAAVLDEELLVCFQRTVDGKVEREFAAVA
jgi:hypothetical protein